MARNQAQSVATLKKEQLKTKTLKARRQEIRDQIAATLEKVMSLPSIQPRAKSNKRAWDSNEVEDLVAVVDTKQELVKERVIKDAPQPQFSQEFQRLSPEKIK